MLHGRWKRVMVGSGIVARCGMLEEDTVHVGGSLSRADEVGIVMTTTTTATTIGR